MEHLDLPLHRPSQPQIASRSVGSCLRFLDGKSFSFPTNQLFFVGLCTALFRLRRVYDLHTTAKSRLKCSLMTLDLVEVCPFTPL